MRTTRSESDGHRDPRRRSRRVVALFSKKPPRARYCLWTASTRSLRILTESSTRAQARFRTPSFEPTVLRRPRRIVTSPKRLADRRLRRRHLTSLGLAVAPSIRDQPASGDAAADEARNANCPRSWWSEATGSSMRRRRPAIESLAARGRPCVRRAGLSPRRWHGRIWPRPRSALKLPEEEAASLDRHQHDWTIPQERGVAPGKRHPGVGVHTAIGRLATVAGSPSADLEEALPVSVRRSRCFIGDRLDTDILGASRAGIARSGAHGTIGQARACRSCGIAP